MKEKLNAIQINQLRYMLKRKFLIGVEPALDGAIDKAIAQGAHFDDVVTISLTMRQHIVPELEDGVIQLEKV